MDREEILRQAQDRLPDVDKWDMPIIAIPISKKLPLFVNNDHLQKESSFYEVRYEKRIDENNKVIWRLMGIY